MASEWRGGIGLAIMVVVPIAMAEAGTRHLLDLVPDWAVVSIIALAMIASTYLVLTTDVVGKWGRRHRMVALSVFLISGSAVGCLSGWAAWSSLDKKAHSVESASGEGAKPTLVSVPPDTASAAKPEEKPTPTKPRARRTKKNPIRKPLVAVLAAARPTATPVVWMALIDTSQIDLAYELKDNFEFAGWSTREGFITNSEDLVEAQGIIVQWNTVERVQRIATSLLDNGFSGISTRVSPEIDQLWVTIGYPVKRRSGQ